MTMLKTPRQAKSTLHTGGKDVDSSLPIINASRFRNEIRLCASDYIDSFFCDKTDPFGNPIPHSLLHESSNIDFVIDTRLEEAVGCFYEELEAKYVVPTSNKDHLMLWRERYVLDLLHECKSRDIPKQYAGGIIVLFLRFCCNLKQKMKASA